MANARDFFDPSIQAAQFVGDRVANLSAKDILAHNGKLVAQWEISLDPEAQLKALERFVKEDSLGKIFADGEVINTIDARRTSTISFYKLEDGSGVQIAKIAGGENSMLALLSKADISDLDLMPKYREPKAEAPDAPKTAKMSIQGAEITVRLEEPKQVVKKHREPISMERAGGAMNVNMRNPVAMKEFLVRAWTAPSMSLPSSRAEDMPYAAIVATSPECYPADDAWPKGIKVVDIKSGEEISGPAKAVAAFGRALEGKEGPDLTREDLVKQLASRAPKM